VCELFGVNVTVHDIHYSYYIKNSYQITKVMSLSLLLVQWILSTYVVWSRKTIARASELGAVNKIRTLTIYLRYM